MKQPDLPPGEPVMNLAELRTRKDYRVCKDSQDPRGWPVRTADDRELGKITDLVIDLDGLNARYLVCTFAGDHTRRVLLPTGFARLDPRAHVVHLDFITRQDVRRLPSYSGLPISPEQTLDLESALTLREPPVRDSVIVRRDPADAE